MRSNREYDLATAITIQPLTQPLMYKMGSSIFADMNWLKVAITTWASLPIIPSVNRTHREKCFCWSWQCCPWLSFYIFPTKPTSYPFPLASKYPRRHLKNWRQWYLPSRSLIGPVLTGHTLFMGQSLFDTPPPQICCGLSGLGFRSIRSDGIKIVW